MDCKSRIGSPKVFFHEMDTKNCFSSRRSKLKAEVEQLSDEQIASCDFQEWTNYLVSKYMVDPILIFETSIEKTIATSVVKVSNAFYGFPGEPCYYEKDAVCVTFTIPFDGEPTLFDLQPSNYILDRFSTQHFIAPHDDQCGSFTLDFEYSKEELESQGNSMLEYVQNQFERKFGDYKRMIDNVNSEATAYNNSLADYTMQLLEDRKKKADSFSAICNALQIPLKASSNAPNTTPIPLKRIVRQPPVKPAAKPQIPEAYISDGDYENINNIISMCGTAMEKTARTYYGNVEEELRDHLLATLNTHYKAATGETFRKIGKTDIQIEFDNKAAFIGECKIWSGEKVFEGAIQQILNYSTWRDVKLSVIIFNKNNQSFPTIQKKITEWVAANTKSYEQSQQNIWKCKYHRQDMNIDIQLTILAFDLYIDKSQFKDSRY